VSKANLIQALVALALFGAGVVTGLGAAQSSDSPFRREQKRTDLTGAPDMEVIASIVEIKPGESSEQHFHHGVEAYYVIQGAKVQPPGKEPFEIATGTSNMNLRNVKHGAFKIVGDTPLRLFTAHIVDKGKPLYDYAK
jgi:quercetin dioxygenase-like cupin family protein